MQRPWQRAAALIKDDGRGGTRELFNVKSDEQRIIRKRDRRNKEREGDTQ